MLRSRRVRDVLRGVWLGHPLHPGAAQVTLGAFASATLIDSVDGDRRASSYAGALISRSRGGSGQMLSLHTGEIVGTDGDRRIVCPWHGSEYGLDGCVLHGPATAPVPRFDARVGGQVQAKVVALPAQAG